MICQNHTESIYSSQSEFWYVKILTSHISPNPILPILLNHWSIYSCNNIWLCSVKILICKWLTCLQTGVEMELQESMALLEWFANNYKSFGKFSGLCVLVDMLCKCNRILGNHQQSSGRWDLNSYTFFFRNIKKFPA